MRVLLGVVVVAVAMISVAEVGAHPSVNKWELNCFGPVIMRIVLCGIDFPLVGASSSREGSGQSSGGRDTPSPSPIPTGPLPVANSSLLLPAHAVGGLRVKRNVGGETMCELDGSIASVALLRAMPGSSCSSSFGFHGSYLYVYPPCRGLFLVAVCQPII